MTFLSAAGGVSGGFRGSTGSSGSGLKKGVLEPWNRACAED